MDLDDERVFGGQASLGAALQMSRARVALEYNASRVNTLSLKVGLGR